MDRNKIMRRIGKDISSSEAGFIDGVTAGTSANGKAVVLDDNGKIDALDVTTLTINGIELTANAVELNYLDRSRETTTYTSAGALTVDQQLQKLALGTSGAVTLAAPSTSFNGRTMVIEMTADNGDVTLALTNVVGQSSGTTATFNDVGDVLVLLGLTDKWLVLKEHGITLS